MVGYRAPLWEEDDRDSYVNNGLREGGLETLFIEQPRMSYRWRGTAERSVFAGG
jgi:hypothetical protein